MTVVQDISRAECRVCREEDKRRRAKANEREKEKERERKKERRGIRGRRGLKAHSWRKNWEVCFFVSFLFVFRSSFVLLGDLTCLGSKLSAVCVEFCRVSSAL